MIDIKTVEYDVTLVTENGSKYLLNNVLVSLQWEEQTNELAQRATLTLANTSIGNTWVAALAKINCIILINAKWNGGRQLVFEGTIWEWGYVSSTQKELTITAYDRLIRLQQSKDFKYYSAGMTTQALIGDICGDWGIPLVYKWSQSMIHEKKVFSADKISDMIIGLLEEVKQKTGEKYIAYFRDRQLQIVGYGTNTPVYKFNSNNTVSTLNKLTINDLVTRVKIIGNQDDDERASVDATLDGDTSFGVLQEIVRRDANTTLETAMDEANAIIKDRGKPEEVTQITVPDIPFVRRGDTIEAEAGNLKGLFSVEGVSHYATTRQMTLTVSRFVRPAQSAATGTSQAKFQDGDEVILNGAVYLDSFGNGRGLTFTNHRDTITIVAPLSRPCPYHVGHIGWVYPESITRV